MVMATRPLHRPPYMAAILCLLLLFLVWKDTIGIPFPNVFRGLVQTICLLYGGMYLLAHLSRVALGKYWMVFGYLAALGASAAFSTDPVYVLLHAGSLMAVILFAIAYYESSIGRLERSNAVLVYAAVALYLVTCLFSLGVLVVAPGRAYETITVHRRFRGLFAEPGMMANAAGILLGLSLFGIKSRAVKIAGIAVGATCLGLAMSRTNWVAAFLAVCATAWLYHGSAWRKAVLAASSLVLVGWLTVLVHGPVNIEAVSQVARTESLATFSGRTALWQATLRAFLVSPAFGNGFTTGVDALVMSAKRTEQRYIEYIADLKGRHGTVHNGYLQSLLDAGVVGTVFYVAVIVCAWYRLFRRDAGRRHPALFYLVTYAAVANGGKNFIYAASVADSVLFWIAAIFAIAVPATVLAEPAQTAKRAVRYPNLLMGRRPRILAWPSGARPDA